MIQAAIGNLREAERAAVMAPSDRPENWVRVAEGWAALAALMPAMNEPSIMSAEPAGDVCSHGRGVVLTGGVYPNMQPIWIHAADGNRCDTPPTF